MRFQFIVTVMVLSSLTMFAQNHSECKLDTIYSSDDYLYNSTYFKEYTKVDSFPRYQGGLDSIRIHFMRSVHLEGAETELFAKYHVIFLVDCQGRLSGFELKSKPFPGYEKIVDACTKMPLWIPAIKNNFAVNCYYRLGFTNRAGNLDVDYREH